MTLPRPIFDAPRRPSPRPVGVDRQRCVEALARLLSYVPPTRLVHDPAFRARLIEKYPDLFDDAADARPDDTAPLVPTDTESGRV